MGSYFNECLYLLMDIIPIIGWILVLVVMCSPSVTEDDKYGVQL